MINNFRPIDRQTGFLLPPSVDEWLPEKHLARFIVEVIDGLDLRAMSGSYRGSGSASYHPCMLLGILVYGYATGVFSSRKLERATYDSVAFRFIAANDHPDHDTIATFRRRFLKEIEALFVQVLRLDLRARLSDFPQALLAPRQFFGDRHPVGNVRGVRRLGFGQQCSHFGLQLRFDPAGVLIGKRAMPAGVGVDLRAVQRDRAHHLQNAHLAPQSAAPAACRRASCLSPPFWPPAPRVWPHARQVRARNAPWRRCRKTRSISPTRSRASCR